MRYYVVVVAVAAALTAPLCVADDYVNGYVRDDGTYAQGHWRSSPNSTRLDNYSTRGNVNPYTGEIGGEPQYERPDYGTEIEEPDYDNYGR